MEENFRNILTDNSEVLFDSLIDNELLKEIPIIGTSINLIKGIKSIRDKAYLNKIKYFLENIGEINESQKKRLIEESKKDKKRRAKFGESLFTTLEKSDSLTKVEYLAVAFEAFLNLDIDDADLRLICHAINISYIDELIQIVELKNVSEQILRYNVSSGLAIAVYRDLTVDMTNTQPDYKLSIAAEKLRAAWKKHKF